MEATNIEIQDFTCDLSEQDLNDIREIIEIGRISWSPKKRCVTTHPYSGGFRLYTPYDSNNLTNISPDVANVAQYALQPGFWRCCAGTGNRKIFEIFKTLIKTALDDYNRPFSMAACILSESTVDPHVHLVDPDKNITTTTYYWTLTNYPCHCDFVYRDQYMPMYRQGRLELDPTVIHGADFKDKNMRFFVAIDSA